MSRSKFGLFRETLHSTIAGWLFAALLISLLVGLQAIDLGPMRQIEAIGIDLGMRAHVHFDLLRVERTTKTMTYAFVDVDNFACEAFLDGASPDTCYSANPVRSSLLIDLVRALRESGASVVVVDVAPPDAESEREREAWRKGLVANDGPWIIAPILARPSDKFGDGLSLRGDQTHDIVPGGASGRLRLASVATLVDPEVDDGVLRHYPTASRVYQSEEAVQWVPTIPYLAARLACAAASPSPSASAPDIGPGSCKGQQDLAAFAAVPANQVLDVGNLAVTPEVVRFFYSLPGLSTMSDTDRIRAQIRTRTVYQRYEASALIKRQGCVHLDIDTRPRPGCFEARADLFKGKLVLLGSSSATVLDRFQTPIGPMSGGEVILNATRAFAEFPAMRTPPFWKMWREKLWQLIAPTGIAFAMWLLIHAVLNLIDSRAQRQADGRPRFYVRWGKGVMATAIFLLGMAFAASLELHDLITQLSDPARLAEPVDMLLPVLAMGLEGFAEGAKFIQEGFHNTAALATQYALTVWHRLNRNFAGRRRKSGDHKEPKP